ncbi:MAG TPA: flippase-like domain-containing protein [Clostridiales bacterium]|nr:flippase-like domain-containing protein [Clostridiales bacterium]
MGTRIVSRKNQVRSILFVVLLMAITISVMLKEYRISEIARVIRSVHPFYLCAGILMMFVYVGCQALNLNLILRRLGHPASYLKCIGYAYVGTYFGAITPGASGAQPAQVYYMNKDRIHVDLSAITVFLMVSVSQIVMLVYGGLAAVLRFEYVSGYKTWMKYLIIAGAAVILGLTLILVAVMFLGKTVPFLIRNGLRLGEKVRLVKNGEELKRKLDGLVASYQDKSHYILKHPGLFVRVFLVALVQWTAYYMVSYLVYLGFGHRSAGAVDLMAGQALISIAVVAIPLPGAVGIAENAFLNVFLRFYSMDELPSAMVLTRVINFYMPLLIAFAFYMTVHVRAMRQNRLKKKNHPWMTTPGNGSNHRL